jgi:hypothetical protein
VRRLVDDDETAHEIAAEAFTRLLSRWSGLDNPQSYLYMIATNLVRDHWRKTSRERRAIRTMTATLPRDPSWHPAQDVDVRDLLESLPPPLRSAFLLHYYGGFGVKRVAVRAEAPEEPSRPTCITRAPSSRQRSVSRHDGVVRGDAVTDRRDPIETWLSSDVELLPPPPGAFERVHRRARHRRAIKATSAAAGAAVIVVAGVVIPQVAGAFRTNNVPAAKIIMTPKPAQLEIPFWLNGRFAAGLPVVSRDLADVGAGSSVQPAIVAISGSLEKDREAVRAWADAGATHLLLELANDADGGRHDPLMARTASARSGSSTASTAGRTDPRYTQPTTAERPGAP